MSDGESTRHGFSVRVGTPRLNREDILHFDSDDDDFVEDTPKARARTVRKRPRSPPAAAAEPASGAIQVDGGGTTKKNQRPKPQSKGVARVAPQQSTLPLNFLGGKSTRGGGGGRTGEMWVDKHAPRFMDDLAVHKKKRGEVKDWIQTAVQVLKAGGMGPRLLLLTGPPGCGKTALVRVACSALGLEAVEWVPPVQVEFVRSELYSSSDARLEYRPFVEDFREFLLRSQRYRTLSFVDEKDKIIVLDGIETMADSGRTAVAKFQDAISTFLGQSRFPMVCISSESGNDYRHNIKRVLGKDIVNSPAVTSISCNPVSDTEMRKCLDGIAKAEGLVQAAPSLIDEYVATSGGDLRQAIMTLQFMGAPPAASASRRQPTVAKGKGKGKGRGSSRKLTRSSTMPEESLSGYMSGRDQGLELLHALGKVLYAKRAPADATGHGRLEFDVDQVLSLVHTDAPMFNAFLHQNYTDFFGEIDDVAEALSNLSDADLFCSDSFIPGNNIMSQYSSSVASRGMIVSNHNKTPSTFRPMHKPELLQARTRQAEVDDELDRNFVLENRSRSTLTYPKRTLATEIIPAISLMTRHVASHVPLTTGQRRHVYNTSGYFRNGACRIQRARIDQAPGADEEAMEYFVADDMAQAGGVGDDGAGQVGQAGLPSPNESTVVSVRHDGGGDGGGEVEDIEDFDD